MKISLDYHSSEPLTQQVVLQIKRLIVTGTLKTGDRLPSVRQFEDGFSMPMEPRLQAGS